jgi:ABC-type polysaccharide/polyol phosphate transport system ATPase subunit
MSSSSYSVQFNNVSKLFYKQEHRTFKEFLPALFSGKKTANFFWALKDVSFKLEKGETIGVIGRNGSGKSTLLKLMAGVSKPTKGSTKVEGRVAPLIELGAGFHPELTGRENVFLNGVILGMRRKEIAEKMDEIVSFAELQDFIDQPIKHYSSGMYLRLAFSVAIHVHADILLLDEILAVGDAVFQQKCREKMKEMQSKNKTIVLVSHDANLVKSFCSKVIWLDRGELKMFDETEKVFEKYPVV